MNHIHQVPTLLTLITRL